MLPAAAWYGPLVAAFLLPVDFRKGEQFKNLLVRVLLRGSYDWGQLTLIQFFFFAII